MTDRIIDHLRVDVVGATEDVEARSFGCATYLAAHPNLPPLSRTQISSNSAHSLLQAPYIRSEYQYPAPVVLFLASFTGFTSLAANYFTG